MKFIQNMKKYPLYLAQVYIVLGVSLGGLGLNTAHAELYQCMIEGVPLYTDQYCGPSTIKMAMPMPASEGISLVHPDAIKAVADLRQIREQEQDANRLIQAQRRLNKTEAEFQEHQVALDTQLLSLANKPAYRNWQSNEVRARKMRMEKEQLKSQLKHSKSEYKSIKDQLIDQIQSLRSRIK